MKLIAGLPVKLALGVLLAWLLLWPPRARGDAWTLPAGRGQAIVTLAGTEIGHEFDGAGRIRPFGDGGRFRKLEINPYFEYGVNQRTTLIVNAFLPALGYSNRYGSNGSFGLGDVETGLRRRLNSPESRGAIAAQFTIKIPAYFLKRNPLPGNGQVDGEGRILVGRGLELGSRHSFVSAGAGYRYRNGFPADQVRWDAAWGIDLDRRVMLMAQCSGIMSVRNGSPIAVTTNPTLRSDFDLYRGQISLVTRVARRMRIQCGWVAAFAGRNTGHGQTLLVAIWKDF